MKSDLIIFGAGGHTRSLIPLIRANGYRVYAIYDNSFLAGEKEKIDDVLIVGKIDAFKGDSKIVLSFGDGKTRSEFLNSFKINVLNENLIHKTAIIESSTKIENSNQIFAGVLINAQVKIGTNNIINSGAIIEHEVIIGNHNHISVGSIIAGRVKIGNYCFIGAGAVIIDKIKITDNVIIGANSLVLKDIIEPGTYVGNPARKIK